MAQIGPFPAIRSPDEVTLYALRHSSIARQILSDDPVRAVAVSHDTSVPMIERTYSRYIADHADQIARGALLETSDEPAPGGGAQVVPLRVHG